MTYQYARDTRVPVNQSRGELERILERVGADAIGTMKDSTAAKVAFRLDGRHYVVTLAFPVDKDLRPSRAPMQDRRDQAIREKWRALVLLVKAKVVAIDAGVTTPEAEFLAHAMLPSGQTLGEHLSEHPEQLTTTGRLMLPGGTP